MDCFKFLEIDPTDDKKIIKRAYAQLLRRYNPENDLLGFESLRKAYEEALKFKLTDIRSEDKSAEDLFLEKVKNLYDNFSLRINPAKWKALLDDEICVMPDSKKIISDKLISFFKSNYYLPQVVWALLNRHFNWKADKENLELKFTPQFVQFLIYNIENPDRISYRELKSLEGSKADEFIKNLSEAASALDLSDFYTAKKFMTIADNIMKNNSDLKILKASYLVEYGKPYHAEKFLNQILDENSNNIKALFKRGLLYYRLCKYEKCILDIKKVLINNPENTDAMTVYIKCCITLNKIDEAVAISKKLKNKLPYDNTVYSIYSSTLKMQIDKLKNNLEIENSIENKLEIKVNLLKSYYNIGNFEDCKNLISDIESDNQMNEKVLIIYSLILIQEKKPEVALTTIQNYLLTSKETHEILAIVASIYDELQDYDKALIYYDKAINLKKDVSRYYNNKAYVLNILNKPNEALKELKKAIKYEKYNAHAYKNMAKAFLKLKLYQDSIECCDIAIEISQYFAEVYLLKMQIMIEVEKYDEALIIYNTASERGLLSAKFFCEKARLFISLKRYDEAFDLCEAALAQDDSEAMANYYKAVVYFHQERLDEALLNFEYCIIKDKRNTAAYLYKMIVLNKKREFHELKIFIEKLLKDNLLRKVLEFDKIRELINKIVKSNKSLHINKDTMLQEVSSKIQPTHNFQEPSNTTLEESSSELKKENYDLKESNNFDSNNNDFKEHNMAPHFNDKIKNLDVGDEGHDLDFEDEGHDLDAGDEGHNLDYGDANSNSASSEFSKDKLVNNNVNDLNSFANNFKTLDKEYDTENWGLSNSVFEEELNEEVEGQFFLKENDNKSIKNGNNNEELKEKYASEKNLNQFKYDNIIINKDKLLYDDDNPNEDNLIEDDSTNEDNRIEDDSTNEDNIIDDFDSTNEDNIIDDFNSTNEDNIIDDFNSTNDDNIIINDDNIIYDDIIYDEDIKNKSTSEAINLDANSKKNLDGDEFKNSSETKKGNSKNKIVEFKSREKDRELQEKDDLSYLNRFKKVMFFISIIIAYLAILFICIKVINYYFFS